ncbi:hypothetical protein, variant 1 [Aphanomyces astaci]|nr:hypothetical protein, variant 1 [Aphanomyces astaci]ETV69251.1 hypothetical protein, variant 1 [Aphanomyces astaci]|eukprot:XP_009841108.1 hypothetical protein, variant 1 [Aphanomyces astaci]
MQQQLIDGFIIDHLEATTTRPAKGAASHNHVTYDSCGRKVITIASDAKPTCRVPRSPREGKQHPIVLPSHAKRLMQSACADLRLFDDDATTDRRHVYTAPSPRSSRCCPPPSPRPTSVHGNSTRRHADDVVPTAFPAISTTATRSPQSSPRRRRRVLRSEAVVDESLQSPQKPPLDAWGVPREHILEFIRLSVLPCTWAMNIKSMGEWRSADDNDNEDDTRQHATSSHRQHSAAAAAVISTIKFSQQQGASHLPHLVDARDHPQYDLGRKSPQAKQRVLGTRSNAISSAPPVPAVLTSRDLTVEARIHHMLVELQQDPRAWEQFQRRIKEFQDLKKKGTEVDIVQGNKAKAFTVPPPAYRDERSKLRKEQQVQIKAKHKAQLEMEHQRRLEQLDRRAHKLLEQRRRLACQSQGRLWLKVVAVVVITSTWQRLLAAEKKRKSVEFRQVSAVCLIQRVWRRKVHLSNSKAMLQIILKTRQILWSLTFKLMCKNKAKAGGVLRRFLVDYFNGSSETGNFRVMMARWRWRVIHAQRASKAFLSCSRARMVALSLLWDNADRERQRTEKLQLQQNKTVLVTTSSGGAQAADFGADTSAQLATTRRLLRTGIQEESLDEMEQQLSVMQTMLTPIEFQRMQHHAHHVVRIPKSIKAKLLMQYLAAKRAENIQAMQEYAAHVASNTSSR